MLLLKTEYFPKLSIWYKSILRDWATDAGIEKTFSFHVARHTFATLALTAGVDIYTTSQLLGHANIRHTQRYAQIINSKKDHAVSLWTTHLFNNLKQQIYEA